ncbi:hypothetical protein C8D88_104652 [Lentzea atacamensis]|uniref:Chemotaxis methyl-accepting receptor HlyB-like 4HB MCP domain-containing protein n=1 Tax=Lentzea atacamensis TaxID=531938 RepID=A0A316I233_9PSEU|nr:hypothetical protein [Lentzea atacamensis]PWK87491.1 hypothetical protein C8D88_104652 [Lentzea atacamensis]RAS69812.1 hypothetical protein C8D87_101112 [Lentzea atacamensis]
MVIDSQPRQALVRRVTGLARSTPGRLSLIIVVLVLASLASGWLTTWSVSRHERALDDLATQSEPLAHAAQEVYRSLQDADATAASAFLSGGLEPPQLRERYEADIAQAQAALSVATASSPDLTATLAAQLPVYTGLIETARTNNRQGFPVGAAYLREASGLMRTQLLPAAQELYRAETDRVARAQDEANFPWGSVGVALAFVVALVLTQRYLTHKTNRLLNVGLLVATAAAVLSLLWVTTVSVLVMNDVGDSRTASQKVDVLAQARIATLTARGDETLTLVARGAGQAYEKNFVEVSDRLEGLLDHAKALENTEAIDQAMRHFRQWQQVHQRIREADDAGQYNDAVALIDNPYFDSLDQDLVRAIGEARQDFSDEVAVARASLAGTAVGVLVLAVISAVGSTMGLWQRLKEYR